MRFWSARCTSTTRLDGKTAVITGANTGIGKCTAKDFFERGARVILACRSIEKANKAVNDIKAACDDKKNVGELIVTPLDLSSLKSVRSCAKELLEKEKRIDLLINNAGIMMCPLSRTEDGFELHMATNHLGHFLLTLLLLPKITESTPARIVNVSSVGHKFVSRLDFDDLNWERRRYSAVGAYVQTKLCNILFTKELARKLEEWNIKDVTTYSLHPGVIRTELGRHLSKTFFPTVTSLYKNIVGWFIKTPEQGAQTTLYCAVDEKCANETGLYYAECEATNPTNREINEENAKKLWIASLKLVDLPDDYNPFGRC